MKEKSKIFKIKRSEIIQEIVLIIAFIIFLILTLTSDITNYAKLSLSLIYVFFLLFMLKNNCFLIRCYELTNQQLIVNRYFSESEDIDYKKIRQIVIKKVFINHKSTEVLTLFLNRRKLSFTVSELEDYHIFILILVKKGEEFGFKVTSQNAEANYYN